MFRSAGPFRPRGRDSPPQRGCRVGGPGLKGSRYVQLKTSSEPVVSCQLSMYSLRRHLGRVACAWLVAQVCVLATSSAVMALTAPSVAALECTCAHGESHSCPMHHPVEKSKSDCSCRSTSDGPSAVIAALLGPIAVVPAALA